MHRPNSQSKTEGQLYRLVASYLCAVVIRVENRLLATGLDGVKQTVQYPDRLQICRINVVASEPAGRADDIEAAAYHQNRMILSKVTHAMGENSREWHRAAARRGGRRTAGHAGAELHL